MNLQKQRIIWKLWNEPSASFINFIWNDHECKILFIIWPFKTGFLSPSKWTLFQQETHWWHGRCQWRYFYAPKCYYTCGHTIFMTWRYPLNNKQRRHMINPFPPCPVFNCAETIAMYHCIYPPWWFVAEIQPGGAHTSPNHSRIPC